MSRLDRAVHRARRHLSPGEVVVTSSLGMEAEGRRRHVVLLTDRRLLVVPRRAAPPVELDLGASTGGYDATKGLLTLSGGGQQIALRDVDEADARQLVDLLARRRPRSHPADREAQPYVRIIRPA